MRGALSEQVNQVHSSYYLPSMTGIATLILENISSPDQHSIDEHRKHMAHQLAGAESLKGTYPFTLNTSLKAYRLNKYLHNMIHAEHRRLFLENPEQSFVDAGLSEEEKALVRKRDWSGLIHYGVIFFMLEKFGAAIGTSNLHIYAAMRGESLEEFMKTRNT